MTSYSYDAVSRMSQLVQNFTGTSHDLTLDFSYNPAGQIASNTRSNDAFAWTGHYAVNRSYTANGRNQYSAAGGVTPSYDANGNLTTETIGSNTKTWVYDIENRMVGAPGGVVLSYDPLGRLYQLAVNGTATTTFLYDGDALVAEYNNAGTMTRRYVHTVGADVPVLSYQDATLATPRYLFADHQGSIVAQSDAGGAVTAINTYDEYGIPGAANAGRFQYTGQIWLDEIGMYYYKARIYSPTLGRFMQTDRIGYEGGINLYAYVSDDPINHTDPTGEADLNLTNQYDEPLMQEFGRRFDLPGNVYTVFSHGAPYGVAEKGANGSYTFFTPSAVAQRIRSDPHYRTGMPIALLGCRIGKEGSRWIRTFARAMGVPVLAVTTQTWPFRQGRMLWLEAFAADGNHHRDRSQPGAFVVVNGTLASFGFTPREGWQAIALGLNPDTKTLTIRVMQTPDSSSRIRHTEDIEKPYAGK